MPIFPRYTGISTDVAYDKAVEAPSDPQPRQIQALGAATEDAGQVFAHVARKRQELEDEAETQKRYMQAVTDMESMHENLNVPVNALQAKSLFGKQLSEREPEWFKGLNDRQQDMLAKRLFPKRLEYQVGAAKLENRAKLEDYNATMVKAQTHYADVAARRLGPDDGAATPEYKDYVRMVDVGVAVGYIKPEKGEEMKDGALKQGAYSRVYRTTASDSQEEIKRVLELYKQSEAATDPKDDPTFLKHIDPKERISLKKQLTERLHSLESEEQRKVREARADTARMNTELRDATTTLASQKLREPAKYGALTSDWLDLAADLRLLDDKDYDRLKQSVDVTGGTGDPATLRRYSVAVFDTSTPEQAAKLRDELKADIAARRVPAGPNSIGSQWLNHLEEKVKAGGQDKPPTMQQQTDDLKQLIKHELRVSGQFDPMNDAERAVIGEALRDFDKNAAAGYPQDPWKIYNDNIDKWQARVGSPGKFKSNELRRTLGMPPRQKGGKDDTIVQKFDVLQKEAESAPPGPEGDAIRNSVREKKRVLKRIDDIDKELQNFEGLRGQSKAARQDQKKQQPGGNAPLAGPRK
jgi:hypothetical protein